MHIYIYIYRSAAWGVGYKGQTSIAGRVKMVPQFNPPPCKDAGMVKWSGALGYVAKVAACTSPCWMDGGRLG